MTWFHSSIVALVLFTTGWGGDACGRTALAERRAPSTQAEKLRRSPHDVYGKVRSVKGSQLTLETRTGRLLQVDATAAVQAHLSVVPVVGHAIEVRGTFDPRGVLRAETILRAKDSPAAWPADR